MTARVTIKAIINGRSMAIRNLTGIITKVMGITMTVRMTDTGIALPATTKKASARHYSPHLIF